jgi:hypothetical protein
MAPTGNPIHRSSSRPQLDVSKAEIQSNVEDKYPTILLPNQSDDLSHLALDIGGIYYYFFLLFMFSSYYCSCNVMVSFGVLFFLLLNCLSFLPLCILSFCCVFLSFFRWGLELAFWVSKICEM